jgi:hypothetical protein
MDKRLYGLTFAMVLTAGIAASNVPVAAQLGPALGKKWAETCLSERTKPAYRELLERIKLGGSSTSVGEAMVACCRRQNTADSACKNLEKDQGGRTNCEQGLTTCQTIVKADPGVKADLDKAKADKEKADKAKADTAAAGVLTVTVNNTGKIPLKVVILDMSKNDIGRTPDYKTGSIPPITLKQNVTKYHWEVFAPGDVEPCQIGHDETKSSITVQCQRSKAEEKPPITLPRLISDLSTKWVDKCAPDGGPFGAGGAVATCCSRQRRAEAACQTAPGTLDSSGSCNVAERTCQETVLERAPSRLK